MMDESCDVRLECFSLPGLFSLPLNLPDYQRSYSWRGEHVLDLLKDTFDRATPYLMGTVILHDNLDNNGKQAMDIVDGQQRLVTLTILLQELGCQQSTPLPLLDATFSDGAARVIQDSRAVIREFLGGKSTADKEKFRMRLLALGDGKEDGCLLFTALVLKGKNALDRAYTFFDSVNSKGKPLSDFDLLKAHHLMFIPPKQEVLASKHNDEWQRRDESHAQIFATVLRRLRMWGRGEERDGKGERPDYNEFRSVVEPEHGMENEHALNRYMQPAAFRSWRRVGEKIVLSMDYPSLDGEELVPTEITQTIEGGDAFFLYAKRYHRLYEELFTSDMGKPSTEVSFVRRLASHIDNLYLQNAFRAVILLYMDKFGEDRLIESGVCMERIISAWRWEARSLRLEGTLSHVRAKRLVPILLDSINSLHAYAQLLGICQRLPPVPRDLAGVQRRYYESIKGFYRCELPKILDGRAQSIARSHYNVE